MLSTPDDEPADSTGRTFFLKEDIKSPENHALNFIIRQLICRFESFKKAIRNFIFAVRITKYAGYQLAVFYIIRMFYYVSKMHTNYITIIVI